jgi:glycosyltransferase involved in cell wall biosynthesis
MFLLTLKDLPPPPNGKIGFPWTEAPPPQYINDDLPKISIITPSFNQGQFIEETIRSVLLQGYPNLEYIIIDGGSTDNTVEIIKKYCDFIHYWVSEKDNGQSDAINKGLKHATGEVFNWLNSDDFYLPNALINVGNAFRNKELNVFCAQLFVEAKDGKRSHFRGTFLENTIEKTITSRYFCQPPTFFRLSIVKELGGIESQLYFCMDLELWINYLAHFGHKGVMESAIFLAVFRLHDASKTEKSISTMHTDHINLLLSLIDSITLNSSFSHLFRKEKINFIRYFKKKYPASKINEKELAKAITYSLLHYYCQFMSWRLFFELYFSTLQQQFFNREFRIYIMPFIKTKRILDTLL